MITVTDRGRLTQSETLRGDSAAPRRAVLRVPPARVAEAAAALSAAGLSASPQADGSLHLPAAREEDVSRAVRTLALADVPVLEARSSADLEELFRKSDAP